MMKINIMEIKKIYQDKIAKSSKEIKRANKICDKANKRLKISILDDLSFPNLNKKKASDIHLNSFLNFTNKNSKNFK